MDACRHHPDDELMELDDGTRICIACHAAMADERYLHDVAPPVKGGSFFVVPAEADYAAMADALKPMTIRFSVRDRERAKVLAKAKGLGSYQSYLKQLITEGLDRDEKRLFGMKVGESSPTGKGKRPGKQLAEASPSTSARRKRSR